jgi:excinuclease ABC subunit C
LIQQVRDEAHRFAITGHRKKRSKRLRTSILEGVPGLGPTRRREILKQLGGLSGARGASLEDFRRIKGIGASLASQIYRHLHPEE